jgi:DNA polymerase
MSLAREQVLKELGIAPVWRLKQAVSADTAVSADAGTDRRSRILQMDWAQLKETIRTCTACELHKTRTQGVVGVGDEKAEWLIIGEAPGADEDAQGEPFVGQAGKLLDAMLAAIGLKRGENVYIANVLKSRPPGNRNPAPEEVAACLPYLERQIQLIQPKIIIALGRFAVQSLLNTEEAIGKLRGRVHQYQGVPLIVTYHPAYLLRNLPDKEKAWEDLCLARETMNKIR